MAVYEVVYNRHDKLSSDAHVGSHPTPTSTVVAPLAQANVAVIEADNTEDAIAAARVAYGDPVSDYFVRELTSDESAGVVVAVHDERPVGTVAEPDAGVETQVVPIPTEDGTVTPPVDPTGPTEIDPETNQPVVSEAPVADQPTSSTGPVVDTSTETSVAPEPDIASNSTDAPAPEDATHETETTTNPVTPVEPPVEPVAPADSAADTPTNAVENAEQAAEAEADQTAEQTDTPADTGARCVRSTRGL